MSRYLFPRRHFYAPMDEEALRRYQLFRSLGMFPVAMHSARGAAQFLRAGAHVLDRGEILAVTAQGQFTDVRARPVVFRPGLAALLHRRLLQGKRTAVLPLAVEYTFWDQRLPEVLVNCGHVLQFEGEPSALTPQNIQAALQNAMAQTQDELAGLALQRNPADFQTVLDGRRGSAGFYGWIERFRSFLPGSPQRGDHQSAVLDQASAEAAAHIHAESTKD